MPRQYDGVPPERPERNAWSDQIADKLGDILNGVHRPGDAVRPPHEHTRPVLGDFNQERPGLTKGPDDQARLGGADADATARHFAAQADFSQHLEHLNSQAPGAHPDWFLL